MKRKTRIERVYNEDTGWFETREVELNSYSFTDDDRIMIVREYMESGLPAEEIIKKYYISSRTVLFSWMDKFLNEKDLLSLPPEDQNRDDMAKTTDSDHNYRKYPNLIKGVVPTHPNQIWASDITYVETNEGVCYLSLITDLYSHKIVGWAVGPTLETVYPLEALKMAYKSIDEETAKGLIHHSDRGSQYCSQNYVSILKSHGSQISMTQTGDPLENAIAERANGILKTEWLYRMTIPTRKVCKKELTRIIAFYNDERPHMSIGNQTPSVAHTQAGPQQKMWKNPWENSSN